MREHPDLWQGYFGYWQNKFIQQNILLLGHAAWKGYLNDGRGMVVCRVLEEISGAIDWTVETVAFEHTYVPEVQIVSYLRGFELEPETVTALLRAIGNYNPSRAIALLVIGNGAVDLNVLQNLMPSPSACYDQVQQRWAEFQTDSLPGRRG